MLPLPGYIQNDSGRGLFYIVDAKERKNWNEQLLYL